MTTAKMDVLAGVTAAQYGSTNNIPRVTVNTAGRVTAIDSVPANYIPTGVLIGGDLTGSYGSGTLTLNLASPALTGRMRVFPDFTARNAAIPDFVGQMGYQTDTGYHYFANLVTPGSWANPFKVAQPITTSGAVSASNYEMTTASYYGFFNGSNLLEGSGSLKAINLPATSGTLVTLAGTEALTNKTVNGLTLTPATATLTLANSSSLITSGAYANGMRDIRKRIKGLQFAAFFPKPSDRPFPLPQALLPAFRVVLLQKKPSGLESLVDYP